MSHRRHDGSPICLVLSSHAPPGSFWDMGGRWRSGGRLARNFPHEHGQVGRRRQSAGEDHRIGDLLVGLGRWVCWLRLPRTAFFLLGGIHPGRKLTLRWAQQLIDIAGNKIVAIGHIFVASPLQSLGHHRNAAVGPGQREQPCDRLSEITEAQAHNVSRDLFVDLTNASTWVLDQIAWKRKNHIKNRTSLHFPWGERPNLEVSGVQNFCIRFCCLPFDVGVSILCSPRVARLPNCNEVANNRPSAKVFHPSRQHVVENDTLHCMDIQRKLLTRQLLQACQRIQILSK
mmetsp:Transcript_43776/g.115676  ORF Transcript_43776/g.115676 Transcript_43776/m.115676 type:complete len:287 (-) Transcript_43776:874-1734(-)